jgi:hypothetical protein
MRRLVLVAVLAGLFVPASAHATFPGANGKIAFVRNADIWTMNPDGTGQVNLTNSAATEGDPAWSPDGTKIAFSGPRVQSSGGPQVYVMNADGSGVIHLGNGVTPDHEPRWSPDGTEIAFLQNVYNVYAMPAVAETTSRRHVGMRPSCTCRSSLDELDWSPAGDAIAADFFCLPDTFGAVVGKFPASGGSFAPLSSGTSCDGTTDLPNDDVGPTWSPDSQRIAFFRAPNFGTDPAGTYTMRPDGSDLAYVGAVFGNTAAWSPDQSKMAYTFGSRIRTMNSDTTGVVDVTDGADPDWQPIPINSYPRPKGASPLRVSLVPASAACTSPNRSHGAPLSFGSCAPPAPASGSLTTGTPDANGLPAQMNSYLQLNTVPGDSSTPADEADVTISARVNDVFTSGLADYAGSLRASLPLRITDKDNTPSPGGPGAATTVPFQFGFTIPCAPDPDPLVGSDCSLATSADTLVPGTIKESRRTVWQVGRARVDDGGADGDGSTTADNTVFAVQGVFVP